MGGNTTQSTTSEVLLPWNSSTSMSGRSFVLPPRVTRSLVIPRFQGNEEDFYKAYGSVIAQGHSSLKDAILAARKLHPGKGECRRHLVTNSTTQGGSPMEH